MRNATVWRCGTPRAAIDPGSTSPAVNVHVLIASRDSDLRLGLHVALTNALPDAEFSIVRGDEELLALARSPSPGGIVVIDVRISADAPRLVSGSAFAGNQVVVLGDETTLAAAAWPPEIRTVSTRRGTRAVIDAVVEASRG